MCGGRRGPEHLRLARADIRNILDFENYYQGARVIKLEQNYRSSQNILDYANLVISHNQMRKAKNLWTSSGKGLPIHVRADFTGANEAETIIQRIKNLHRSDKLEYNNFAILFRSNYLSRNLEEMCRRYQIPYQLIGGLKFYDRKEIKDLLAYMRIVVNPRDWTSLVRALGVPTRGIGVKSQDKLYQLFNDGYTVPELLDKAIRDKILAKRGLSGLTEFKKLYDELIEADKNMKPREWLAKLVMALDYPQLSGKAGRGHGREPRRQPG